MRTNKMTKSLYGYYMGYKCYWLNVGFIRQWVAPTKKKPERHETNQGSNIPSFKKSTLIRSTLI